MEVTLLTSVSNEESQPWVQPRPKLNTTADSVLWTEAGRHSLLFTAVMGRALLEQCAYSAGPTFSGHWQNRQSGMIALIQPSGKEWVLGGMRVRANVCLCVGTDPRMVHLAQQSSRHWTRHWNWKANYVDVAQIVTCIVKEVMSVSFLPKPL